MKKSDLKVGYLIEIRDNYGDDNFGILMPVNDYDDLNICKIDDMGIANLSNYNDDLTSKVNSNFDIIRVWGYASILKALTLETDTRDLLWERKEKKTVTLELTDEQLKKIKEIINE